MIRLVGTSAIELPLFWKDVVPFIELGLANDDRYDSSDIYYMIMQKDLQLWRIMRDGKVIGILLTQIIVYPRSKHFFLFLAAGEIVPHVKHIEAALVKVAKAAGCSHSSLEGRYGWQKIFPSWKKKIQLTKVL